MAVEPAVGALAFWVAALLDPDEAAVPLTDRWAATSLGRELLTAARRSGSAHEMSVLDGVLDGCARAFQHVAALPSGTLDAAWAILEALEEVAAVVARGPRTLRERFTEHVAAIARSIGDRTVAATIGWSCNEMLERGEASAALGVALAGTLLANDPPPVVRDVLSVLAELRPPLAQALAALELPASVIPPTDGARAHLARARLTQDQLDGILRDAGSGPLEPREVLAPLVPLLARIHDVTGDPADGVLAMAATKLPLARLCHALTSRPEQEREGLVTAIWAAFIAPLAERDDRSAFLVVEALEGVRDAFPEVSCAAVAGALPSAPPRVAFGLGVCMAEGIEEELAGDPSRRPPRFEVHVAPGGAHRCAYHGADPPSDYDDFGRLALPAAKVDGLIAAVFRWCDDRLHER
ncbi:MAG: hypothetical protein QM820_04725 [Minicystis sp.]